MPRQIIDLDALNPEPQVFVLRGRELVLNHLPHHQFYDLAERVEQLQSLEQGSAGASVREVEHGNKAIVMDMFRPSNPWLDEADEQAHAAALSAWEGEHGLSLDEYGPATHPGIPPPPLRHQFVGVWFDVVPLAVLTYLIRTSMEYMQEGVEVSADGHANGASENGLPPAVAVAKTAAAQRRTGRASTKS